MQIAVLAEPLPDNAGYRASAGEPFNISADGATPLEAVDRVEKLIRAKLDGGAKIIQVNIGQQPARIRTTNPLPNDETTREWLDAVEEYRRQVDEEDKKRVDAVDLNAEPRIFKNEVSARTECIRFSDGLENDEVFQEWREIIEENRRKDDESERR